MKPYPKSRSIESESDEKVCRHCGVRFVNKKHKSVNHCSHICAAATRGENRKKATQSIHITCETCGKEFKVLPGDFRYRKVIRFCSELCKENRGRDESKWTLVYCSTCGAELSRLKVRLKDRNYCNVLCQREYQNKAKWSDEKRKDWGVMMRAAMNNATTKATLRRLNSRNRRPMSDEHKNKLSDANAGRMPANLQDTGLVKYKRGWYDINGTQYFFRSKWEANYALILDSRKAAGLIHSWEYEAKTFMFESILRGTRSYKPDFLIKNLDGSEHYDEVKGYMTPRANTQIKRMAKYFPGVKLNVISSKEYYSLIKSYKGVIKFF